MAQQYTQMPIPGRSPERILRPGVGLVCEGGGTRGFYSAGVFEAFMQAGIMFPHISGISAGAANALTYLSGQQLRSRQLVQHYVGLPQYVSKRNILLHRNMFGFEFIFDEIPKKHIYYDWETALSLPISFNSGSFDCESGETVWFTLDDLRSDTERGDFTSIVASCSVPVMCPVVEYKGKKLLDGGILCSIPIEKSIADGNDFHVIVLTRNAGFVKPPMGHMGIVRALYRKLPAVAEALARRHTVYNEQLALCEQLEREGRAVIIRPENPVGDNRTSSDTAALLALYDEGMENGNAAMAQILEAVE